MAREYSIPVSVRARDPEVAPLVTVGFAPVADSPIVVTHPARWNYATGEWSIDESMWQLTHVATGFCLSRRQWRHKKDALAVIERCDPTFPAWPVAFGSKDDPATVACFVKFRAAVTP